ncbi:MAG: DUF1566 domain-containing protein [Myxococcaceae bacterium]|nr:DUF1566 domain-containing protein [Myxococcaceae bacterium]MBH2005871.1 DUF1566 domain-containing protein [Myxococcaceae bacterium]
MKALSFFRYFFCLCFVSNILFSRSTSWSEGAFRDETSQRIRYDIAPYASPPNITDRLTGLSWLYRPSSAAYSVSQAQSYCQSLGVAWRLPSVLELQSLLDYTMSYSPCQVSGNCEALKYWKSGTYLARDSYNSTGCFGVNLAANPGISTRTVIPSVGCGQSYQLSCTAGDLFLGSRNFKNWNGKDLGNDSYFVWDRSSDLLWGPRETGGCFNQSVANSSCYGINSGESGEQWRLPTVKELLSLVDYSAYPASYSEIFPNMTEFPYYWTSTPSPARDSDSWAYVSFLDGQVGFNESDNLDGCISTICVQNLAYWSTPAYQDTTVSSNSESRYLIGNYNNTVTDTSTWLMWQRSDSGNLNANEMMTYCENNPVAGFIDWRLPSSRELQSLYDYGKMSVDPEFLAKGLDSNLWVADVDSSGFVRAFRLADGSVVQVNQDEKMSVRCVRSGSNGFNMSIAERYLDEEGMPIAESNSTKVLDMLTGMLWQRMGNFSVPANKQRAVCPSNAWRLPTIKELYTLVELSEIGSMNDTVFPDVPECPGYLWASSSNNSEGFYWLTAPSNDVGEVTLQPGISACVRCLLDCPSECEQPTPYCKDHECVECMKDCDCPLSRPHCVNNACVLCSPPEYSCPGSDPYCLDGGCVQCLKDNQCSDATPLCINNECTACSNSTQCEKLSTSNPFCVRGNCVECIDQNNQGCNATSPLTYCINNICVPPLSMWDSRAYEDSTSQTGRFKHTDIVALDYYTDLIWSRYAVNITGRLPVDFKNYCASFGQEFRLPTLMELQSILAYTGPRNSIPFNTVIFPSNSTVNVPDYYLSLELAEQPSYYGTNFKRAFYNPTIEPRNSNISAARCVNGNPFEYPGENRFVNGDKSPLTPASTKVLDQLTGLTWMRFGSMPGMNPDEYCNMVQPSGSWVVPTLKQLMTLVNVTIFPFASPEVFPLMSFPSRTYGTDTVSLDRNGANQTGYVSFVGKEQGITFQQSLNYNPIARLMCVSL